jgi:VCBS repeat-containing protein
VDAASDDFSLQAGSPAIDKGVVLTGFNDVSSPWPYSGSAPDIGAYEYGSGTTVNSAPVAANDAYATSEDTTLTVAAPGVLSNDTDANSDNLTATKVSNPAHGTLTLNANGSFTYTPATSYNGTDTFTYQASDGQASSNTATVTITIGTTNNAPVLNAIGNKTVTEGQLLTFTISAKDPDSDNLTYLASNLPAGATFTSAIRTFAWTPSLGQAGSYPNVHFEVSDGSLTDAENINIDVVAATTDTSPPQISDVSSGSITTTTTDIKWTTDELSNSQVEYWASPSRLSDLNNNMVTNHLVSLTGLSAGTTYHYIVISTDAAGNTSVSQENTFTTSSLTTSSPTTTSLTDFSVSGLSINPTTVPIKKRIAISILITNNGARTSRYNATLKINGTVVASKNLRIQPGATYKQTFYISENTAGTYQVDFNGLTGSFEVIARRR